MYYEEIRKEAFPELDINCFIAKPIPYNLSLVAYHD
jgi:hypothetical protein